MALVFDSQGKYDKTPEWYKRALDGQEKTLGKEHLLLQKGWQRTEASRRQVFGLSIAQEEERRKGETI